MADPTQTVTLAMPIGLPPQGIAPATHFAALQSRLSANLSAAMAKVWVADEAAYSGLFAMSKGFLRMIPAGSAGPDGVTLAAPMLVLKPWLWDYLALRRNTPGGALPRLIGYANVEASAVTLAIRAELAANTRYQALTAAERTQAETDFAAGTIKLLVNAGTMIGRALADPAAQAPAQAGWRRLDLIFFDENNAPLDPSLYFDLWGIIGGAWVAGHPLLAALARPVTPAIAPIEGGTRIRVQGNGLTAGTTVDVDGQPATDIEISADGLTLWATVPAHAAGGTDIDVTVPGQTAVTYSGALGYTEDVATAARAIMLSLAVRLAEIRERVLALAAVGPIDPQIKAELSLATDLARDRAPVLIEQRAIAAGASSTSPEIQQALQGGGDLRSLYVDIRNTVDT